MASNYPPGVTGAEYEIAGPDYEKESDVPCEKCGGEQMEQGYGYERWLVCMDCEETTDLPAPEDPDPDRAYDEERDRQMLEECDES
jgi:ssDNA-binding Zn-finger/Zn-ribbon topoisomerase 1